MENEESTAASASDERNNLETISGIGPAFSEALHEIGIQRFEDLARYTPAELSEALAERAGVKVPPERIESNEWIGQARDLARQANTNRTPSAETAELAGEPNGAPNQLTWRQHAGFSLFFDYVTDELGEEVWQTRVYHDESGEEASFSGTDTASWVNWVLEHAELTAAEPVSGEAEVAEQPAPEEREAAAPSEPTTPDDTEFEILGVQVTEMKPSPVVLGKVLAAEVRFELSGREAERLTAERVPYQIEVHLVDLETETSSLVSSGRSELEPEQYEYTSQQMFPIPEVGRYEVHSIIHLLAPDEMTADHHGPILNIVP